MDVNVGQVMRSINNFFETGYRATSYSITDGAISPGDLFTPGMYIAISGSIFHDGVWQVGESGCLIGYPETVTNESFSGRVWFLHPPGSFIDTCKRIAEFAEKTPVTGVQSEGFGEYSVTHKSGRNGGVLTWQEAFAAELSPYRRMYTEVI